MQVCYLFSVMFGPLPPALHTFSNVLEYDLSLHPKHPGQVHWPHVSLQAHRCMLIAFIGGQADLCPDPNSTTFYVTLEN